MQFLAGVGEDGRSGRRGRLLGRIAAPGSFASQAEEAAFLDQYRTAGLAFVKFALILGAVLALLFFFLVLSIRDDEDPTNLRQLIRLVLGVSLCVAALFIESKPYKAARHYVAIVNGCVLISVLAIGGMSLLPGDLAEPRSGRWTVAMCLACWLAYGFSRLPVYLISISCVIGSTAILASAAIYEDDYVRALSVYLAMANIIGWTMAVEIERRERALFWSARQLAAARTAAETMAREASEADAAKTRVLAAVSHDLRQPLASLTLYAQHLREQDGTDGEAVRQTVDRLEACIGAISSDLDRLSELGLRERGERLPVRAIDLRPVLDRIERVYSGLASRAGVRLVVRVPEPGEYQVVSNESRLWDVFANLVGNALKFPASGRPGWVLVRVRPRRSELEVVVRDNGIGIEASDQRCVFDEYFQVANPSRSAKQGQGLGLSIVRETVSRLPNHSIRLHSRIGEGTMFVLSLPGSRRRHPEAEDRSRRRRASSLHYPLAADARAYPAEPLHVTDVGASRDLRSHGSPDRHGRDVHGSRAGEACVLVVEDDEAMCDALARTLTRWGFVVRCAQSGEEAIALSTGLQHSFDAIVCDFRLPGAWDGLRLIDELRRLEGWRTPAILLSGEFRVEAVRFDAPADVHVMAKPPDVGRLRFLLAQARSHSPIEAG